MVQTRVFLSLAILGLFIFSMPIAWAGDVNNPEVVDTEGDSVSEKSSQDILWGYTGHEDNDTICFVMGLSSLDTFTDPSQILEFPVTDYKFYFSVLGVHYVAVATVPVHGPFGIDIQFELRTVQYNGSTPVGEAQKASITTADYDPVNGIINMTVEKSDIGNPVEGDMAEQLWLAVYSKQREGNFNLSEPVLEDRAPNAGHGKSYIFRGSVGNEIIRMEISTDSSLSHNITPFQKLEIPIMVYNNGTTDLTITMMNSTVDHWTVYFVPSSMTLDEQEGGNVTLIIKIKDKDLRRVKDGQILSLQVWAETNLGNETESDIRTSNFITFTIKASVPPPEEEDKPWWEDLQDKLSEFWEDNSQTVYYAIGGIIALIVVLVILSMIRKKGPKEEGEEFKDLDVKVEDPEKGEPAPED